MNGRRIFSALLLSILVIASGCKSEEPVPQSEPMITEGIYGYVEFWSGDCGIVWNEGECKIEHVQRTLHVYKLTHESDVTPGQAPDFYSEVHTDFAGTTESNELGFFEISLPPGNYSIFIKEKGELYCAYYDAEKNFFPVTVPQHGITQVAVGLTYDATF